MPDTKMDPKVKAKWVAALRSGDYKQGQLALRHGDDKFCCLGVLCDVVDPNGWVESGLGNYLHADGQGSYLPPSIAERVGLRVKPEVPNPVESKWMPSVSLNALNDCEYTFAQIADLIEQHL